MVHGPSSDKVRSRCLLVLTPLLAKEHRDSDRSRGEGRVEAIRVLLFLTGCASWVRERCSRPDVETPLRHR